MQLLTTTNYLDVRQAAEYLGVHERFVRRLISERRIGFHHLGRKIRIAETDLQAFLAAGRTEPVGSR